MASLPTGHLSRGLPGREGGIGAERTNSKELGRQRQQAFLSALGPRKARSMAH
jgi:hypothetical protein